MKINLFKYAQIQLYAHKYDVAVVIVIIKTRNMGQSPTLGRPVPQVRLKIQFMGLVGRVKI